MGRGSSRSDQEERRKIRIPMTFRTLIPRHRSWEHFQWLRTTCRTWDFRLGGPSSQTSICCRRPALRIR